MKARIQSIENGVIKMITETGLPHYAAIGDLCEVPQDPSGSEVRRLRRERSLESDKQLHRAEQLLEDLGYRRCNVADCNCDGYHQQTPEPEI